MIRWVYYRVFNVKKCAWVLRRRKFDYNKEKWIGKSEFVKWITQPLEEEVDAECL